MKKKEGEGGKKRRKKGKRKKSVGKKSGIWRTCA